MPEGDTIWRVAAALRTRISGAIVRRASHTGLEGRRIEVVEPVGKHVLIRFDGGYTLRTHLGMHGSWYVHRPGERWRKPAWQARVVLETDEWVAVCFSAAAAEITRDVAAAVRHLGPDLLGDDPDLELVVQRARQLGAETALGELLLDQRVAAGIGNVYRCETLWAHRLNPWRPAGSLGDDELRALYAYARDALRLNVQGRLARRFPDHPSAAVHGRTGRPCPRCRTPIGIRKQGALARWTYFCPRCQAVDGAPADPS
ncbi:MAG: DNA-formamidopyrimidine glycosylase family protein [Candidatus Dormiibacterota bacterium]